MFLYKPELLADTPICIFVPIGTSKLNVNLCCPGETVKVVSSITLEELFLSSNVIVFEISAYTTADLIIHCFDASNISPDTDLVIVGNAVSRGNPELEVTLDLGIPFSSMPEVLRDYFISGLHSVVITGTHGKTTTTAITAHMFCEAGLDPSFLVAGIPNNFKHSHNLGTGKHFIIEGDEYDSAYFAKWSKFFYYRPRTLIINNIEFDHADIFKDLSDIIHSFKLLVETVPKSGVIIANIEDDSVKEVIKASHTSIQTFGIETDAYWRAEKIEVNSKGTRFTLWQEEKDCGQIHVPLHGKFNIQNTLAAIAAGSNAGINIESLRMGIGSFKGVKRRQELIGIWNDIVLSLIHI